MRPTAPSPATVPVANTLGGSRSPDFRQVRASLKGSMAERLRRSASFHQSAAATPSGGSGSRARGRRSPPSSGTAPSAWGGTPAR